MSSCVASLREVLAPSLYTATAFIALASLASVAVAGPGSAGSSLLDRHVNMIAATAATAAENVVQAHFMSKQQQQRRQQQRLDLATMPIGPRAAVNLQAFQGALAGQTASPIIQSNDATRPFSVDGDTFNDFQSAVDRSCDNQHNACADAVNTQHVQGLTVGDCDDQNTQCKTAGLVATQTAFVQLETSTDDLDIFCDV